MPKGRKRVRGVPELHGELKTRVNLSLTPSGIAGLDTLAAERGISRSELVERIGRRQMILQNSSNNVPIKETTIPELADEFNMSLLQSLDLSQRQNLPECPGVYLLTDFMKYAYVGHAFNLKEKFMNEHFLNQLEFNNDFEILWIKSNDIGALPFIKQALLTAFYLQNVNQAYQSIKNKVLQRSQPRNQRQSGHLDIARFMDLDLEL